MIHKKIGRLRLELYAGIDELPADRYNKFNIYCLLASGVGSDLESVLSHMQHINEALHKNDVDRLKILFRNYHHSLNLILDQVDTRSMAFTCLVHSINGELVTDISDDNLKVVSARITRHVARSRFLEMFRELKKKLRMK